MWMRQERLWHVSCIVCTLFAFADNVCAAAGWSRSRTGGKGIQQGGGWRAGSGCEALRRATRPRSATIGREKLRLVARRWTRISSREEPTAPSVMRTWLPIAVIEADQQLARMSQTSETSACSMILNEKSERGAHKRHRTHGRPYVCPSPLGSPRIWSSTREVLCLTGLT